MTKSLTMTDVSPPPGHTDIRKMARQKRLALALRKNLGKRKDQERQREQVREVPADDVDNQGSG
ncbi:MAG: hypothetical protein ACRCWF_15370 [Beijerinckiaceae bacterium]